MSRRRAAEKREIKPDPQFDSIVVAKFINVMMSDGKKTTAAKIVYEAIGEFFKKVKSLPVTTQDDDGDEGGSGGHSALDYFLIVLNNIRPAVEVKSRRVGGSTYQVPIEVQPARSMALAMRWLKEISYKRKEHSMRERLAAEMIDAFQKRGGAIKKREDVHKMAEANKAFAHYRW